MIHIRQFQWSDYDGVVAVWSTAGRDVVPRAELEAKLTRDPQLFLVAEMLGCPRVNLLVMPDNETGLRFWRALGYLPMPDVLCTKPLQGTRMYPRPKS